MTLKRTLLVLLVVAAAVSIAHAFHGRGRSQHRGGRPASTSTRRRTPVNWPTYGYDSARTHDVPFKLAPPFHLIWKETPDWSLIEFPPIVVHRRLYVGTNHGLLLALDSANGKVVWRRQLDRCIASSPAFAAGLVIVGVMAPPPACDHDTRAYLVALDARDGSTRWLHRTGGPVETSPLVASGSVVFGSWDGRVVALDAATGSLRWTFATNGPVKASVAKEGSTLYVGSYDGSLSALDAGTGRPRWSAAGGAPFYATPTVAEGRVIAATTDGVVHAFAADSGAALWSRRIGRFSYSAAAVAHGRAYVGSYDHRLYALDVRTGRVSWTRTAPGPVSGAPTVLGGQVYFSSCGSCSRYESNARARRTFAVDAATGVEVWSFPDGEYSPLVTDGISLYLTGYTTIYALRPASR